MTRFSWITLFLLSVALVSCYRLPAESSLVENFASHRAEFNRLLKMSTEDWRYCRVSEGQVPRQG